MTTPEPSDPLPAAPASATVIPFPLRSKPLVSARQISRQNAPAIGSPAFANAKVAPRDLTPEQRLTRALASLDAALADQRVAVAAWRDGLVTLKTATAGLAHSLHRYRTNLDALGISVSALRDKTRSLQEWADGMTATAD